MGRPPLRSPAKERKIIRVCVRGGIISGQMPSDIELAHCSEELADASACLATRGVAEVAVTGVAADVTAVLHLLYYLRLAGRGRR